MLLAEGSIKQNLCRTLHQNSDGSAINGNKIIMMIINCGSAYIECTESTYSWPEILHVGIKS